MRLLNKLLIFGCCYFALGLVSGKGQSGGHFVKAGYGAAPIQSVFYGFLKGIFTDVSWQRTDHAGLWQVGYMYQLTDKFEVGLVGAYNHLAQEGRYWQNPNDPNPDPARDYEAVVARERVQYYSLMPTLQLYWKNTDKLKLYSGFSFGGFYRQKEYWQEEEPPVVSSYYNYAVHINAFGVRYGNRLGGFAEIGFGMHGLLNAGVSLKL